MILGLFKNYYEYINSNIWKDKSNNFIYNKGGCCECCNSNKFLTCHHISYKNIGLEKTHDILVLCKYCHFALHFIKKNNIIYKPNNKYCPNCSYRKLYYKQEINLGCCFNCIKLINLMENSNINFKTIEKVNIKTNHKNRKV